MDGLLIILLFAIVTIARNAKKIASAGKNANAPKPQGTQAPIHRFDMDRPQRAEAKPTPHAEAPPIEMSPDANFKAWRGHDSLFSANGDRITQAEDMIPADRVKPMTGKPQPTARPQASKGLLPDLSANGMVRAVLMHEVLTRPAHRRRPGQRRG